MLSGTSFKRGARRSSKAFPYFIASKDRPSGWRQRSSSTGRLLRQQKDYGLPPFESRPNTTEEEGEGK